ncbi:MAG: LysR family transcriptional regulator, partial [Brevundimonas sp.]|nr:LysR family transcriptional regulator [Brevundimonas sp.]
MTRRKDPAETRVPLPHDQLPAFDPVPRKHRHDGWTPERQRAFIGALADTGSVSRAARHVNMSPEGAYYLR